MLSMIISSHPLVPLLEMAVLILGDLRPNGNF